MVEEKLSKPHRVIFIRYMKLIIEGTMSDLSSENTNITTITRIGLHSNNV